MIRIAVFGAGRWGTHLIRNFLDHPQVRLAAVVDPHPQQLAACKAKFGLADEVVLETDWRKAIGQLELEAVAIATPASTHYSLIAAALQCGYHVFAEKPLTLDPQQALDLCHLADRQQRQLFVDHTYLFHPAVERGREIIKSGRLGKLRYGYGTRVHLSPVRQDVDALWDLAIHDIGIFNFWLEEKPNSVQAIGRTWLPQPGIADLVWLTLNYPSGFQAFIHLCWLNPDKQRRLSIAGSTGALIFDEMQPQANLTLQAGSLEPEGKRFIPVEQNREIISIEAQEPLKKACDRFLQCVQRNSPDEISSGWIGAELVQILASASTSLQQNGQAIALAN